MTLALPPFSPMAGRLRFKRHRGRTVVVGDGQRPARRKRSPRRPPLTVALTVTDLSGACTPSSTPVMVTAPVLEV